MQNKKAEKRLREKVDRERFAIVCAGKSGSVDEEFGAKSDAGGFVRFNCVDNDLRSFSALIVVVDCNSVQNLIARVGDINIVVMAIANHEGRAGREKPAILGLRRGRLKAESNAKNE